MLHLVGLGLADEKDITVRGLEIVKKAERVYLEAYTAILLVDKAKLVSGTALLCFLVFLFLHDILLVFWKFPEQLDVFCKSNILTVHPSRKLSTAAK